jgi:nucleotidyltransferase substrate binding protein (TIGR01987 family)
MRLDLSSLKKAINSLEKAVNEYQINDSEFIRDSCIQRFEYTYELSWKTIKRHIEMTSANPQEVDNFSFQELIREANEKGLLLNNWETWKLYRLYRGTTSHAYDQDKANEIYLEIPKFLEEAQYLLKQLEKFST